MEYFISSRGARKGLADTALRTADSGYLTRRLVDVSQDVIIREDDCGADDGLEVFDIREGKEVIESVSRASDRPVSGRGFCGSAETGEVLVSKDKMMTDEDADIIVNAGIKKIQIRSILNCKAKHGVCKKCYGSNLANGKPVTVGEAVGIIAAQSIGEPGTQLTMRTFHTGGVARRRISPRVFPVSRSCLRAESRSTWPSSVRSAARSGLRKSKRTAMPLF